MFHNPEQSLQIAEPTFALFYVGLDHIPRIALARMPIVTLLQLVCDKARVLPGNAFCGEPREHVICQRCIPKQEPAIEQ